MTSQADLRIPTLFNFTSHTALITGGASGLGEMAAQALIQNGAHVIIASRKEAELQKTSSRLNALGPGHCTYIVADLKDKAGCVALCAEVKKRVEKLDLLLNNTGTTWGGEWADFPEEGWDKIMALNVKSVFYVTAGLEGLLAKGADMHKPGRVVNVASVAGLSTRDVTAGEGGGLSRPGTGTFSYGPSKAACIHLTKILASKLAPKNIMVNAICPGVFPSRMTQFGLSKYADTLLATQPTGRVGKAEDFGGLVLFLGSLASAHLTGNVFEIDGGSNVSGWVRGAGKGSKL